MSIRKQKVGIFACQPVFLTLGVKGGFTTIGDFYRYAADCGFTCASVPLVDFIFDYKKARASNSYIDDKHAELQGYGLADGLERLEFHTFGQNVALAQSRKLRFGNFIDGKNFRTLSRDQIEERARRSMYSIIDVAAKAKNSTMRRLVGFFGGYGYAMAQAKWSAWPAHLALWVLASLAYKWQPILEYAAARDVVLCHELGHPENDLLTGANFVLFWKLLSPKARKGLGLNMDGSHFANVGTNPLPHFRVAIEQTGCEVTTHYKWGAVTDRFDGTCSPYGGWQTFADASTTFFTIGTVGPEKLVRDFHTLSEKAHAKQGGGNIIYEGECVGIQHPKLAMQVGAANCLALRDRTELTRLEGFAPVDQPILMKPAPRKVQQLNGPAGITKLMRWGGGPFDKFAEGPVIAPVLLGLSPKVVKGTRAILRDNGYELAAAA